MKNNDSVVVTGERPSVEADPSRAYLRMFTLSDLAAEIEVLRAAARSRPIQASWAALAEVVASLETRGPTGHDDYFVAERAWSIVRISISGFRGVANEPPLEIPLDPTPGITVLHGANGAGKSSVADAIATALSGCFQRGQGTAGKTHLWDPIAVSRGSTSAVIEVCLEDRGTQLRLHYRDVPDADVEWVAHLTEQSIERPIQLGKHWASLLANHNPVIAYASLDRKVQLGSDLRDYFENLLALGGSFARLETEVADRGAQALEAFDEWSRAKKAAASAVSKIDAERAVAGLAGLEAVAFADIDSPIDDWVVRSGANAVGEVTEEVPHSLLATIRSVATEYQVARDPLDNGELVQEAFQAALTEIERIATAASGDNTPCPVCGSTDRDWRRHLGDTVAVMKQTRSVTQRADEAVAKLVASAVERLKPVLDLPIPASADPSLKVARQSGHDALEALIAISNVRGRRAHPDVVSAADALAMWTHLGSSGDLLAYLVAQTDRLNQWRVARAGALVPFVATWKNTQELGSTAQTWRGCADRIKALRNHLRDQRTAALESTATARVQDLLSDVGLRISKVAVQARAATMELEDMSGRPVELGMLSAGQRNAVLLAPVIAVASDSPFGFVVLDDPVHAFDELRVDLLARALSRLAMDRRVVIFTHDERLREHLLAQSVATTSLRVARSPLSGNVTFESSGSIWNELLDDAHIVLQATWAGAAQPRETTNTVRSLCRQAVDSALRAHAVRDAVLLSQDPRTALAELDEMDKTSDRLAKGSTLCSCGAGAVSVISRVTTLLAPHLENWNAASHDNDPPSAATANEIRAARKACKLIAAGPGVE